MDFHSAGGGTGGNRLSQVESGATDRFAGNKARDAFASAGSAGNLFARSNHLPVIRAFKCEIEVAERGTNVGIPGAARAYINYIATGIEHDRPGIFELQL